MTVEDVKERLRRIWQLGREERDVDRRRRIQSLANDFVAAVAAGECTDPTACAKLILLPVNDAFYRDWSWGR